MRMGCQLYTKKCHIASSRYNYLLQNNIGRMESNYLLQCIRLLQWCNALFAFVPSSENHKLDISTLILKRIATFFKLPVFWRRVYTNEYGDFS